jgi:hypothetical protein
MLTVLGGRGYRTDREAGGQLGAVGIVQGEVGGWDYSCECEGVGASCIFELEPTAGLMRNGGEEEEVGLLFMSLVYEQHFLGW